MESVIHAFIASRLDYCNVLYLDVSQSLLSHLQLVQNAAARLLTGKRRENIYFTSLPGALPLVCLNILETTQVLHTLVLHTQVLHTHMMI